MHDLVIENATIIDGGGGPGRRGGLAVKDGRIAAIGDDLDAARERLDADGLTLTPGIVDIHTHYDAQLTWDPYAMPSTALGVTTVVIGNCGFTIAPCRPQDRDLTLRNLTHVEGMSLDALRAGVRWEFESYPEFLDAMARRGVVPNVASFVGHSSVRTYVLGNEGTTRAARASEIVEMRRIVLDAVRAGAIGFATSTLEQHNGENGIPMPSRLADEHELLALTGAWADLLLFDPKTVARGPKRRVHDLPTGASRLDTPGVGVHGVWVNGVRTVDEQGVLTSGKRPGQVLREFSR